MQINYNDNFTVTVSSPVHGESEPLKATQVGQFLLQSEAIFLLLSHKPELPTTELSKTNATKCMHMD